MRPVGQYHIVRALNNNVLVVLTEGREEQILIGKGIGFGAKRGQYIDGTDPRIEKRFSLMTQDNKDHFEQLFSVVAPEVVGVAEELIALTLHVLQRPLHEHIHVALPDHIGFALTRLRGGLNIENPFLDEIRLLYPQEWNIAKTGAEWIAERFGVPIPDEEVGFLTLHIHSATHERGLSETVRVTDAVNTAVRAMKHALRAELLKDRLNYTRLVIHLRFAIQRILRDQPIHHPLADAVAEKLPEPYRMAKWVAEVLEARLKKRVPEDEVSYLAMHIARFTAGHLD
ncbi:PRD domain-containing protein [Alicyclobacillus contaminans]|uniref:PRD domain-containing protein n=1 Tax=Alicyclobacillus contaminans TaxID=392016 RepID=UPI0004276296|nr:PRD domain-containing protein [Alicyclobacillus contaminans]